MSQETAGSESSWDTVEGGLGFRVEGFLGFRV